MTFLQCFVCLFSAQWRRTAWPRKLTESEKRIQTLLWPHEGFSGSFSLLFNSFMLKPHLMAFYTAFYRFEQAKFADGGLILGSSLLLPQLLPPQFKEG